MNKDKKTSLIIWGVIAFIVFVYVIIPMYIGNHKKYDEGSYVYSDDVFSIITSPENKVLEDTIKEYFDDKDFEVRIDYADNLEIVDILNSGVKYDAVWSSNSIWLDMLDSSVKTLNLKSTSITPIVFGIKKSVAKELDLIDKTVSMNDLLTLIKNGKLKFSMANPIMTNSGASAYLNILTTLAGNPEVLKLEHLENEKLKNNLKSFFSGLERTSGDEDFLENSFINGGYDAAFTYESSIININKKLEKMGEEPLYVIYPIDGVSISDSPLVFINNGNNDKKELFLGFQEFILSDDGQEELESLGRRTWYGGVTDKADKDLFKKEWGIDTTKYISSVKYPSKEVIRAAFNLYQLELRKPVHVVFCLDYSGSMQGKGITSLIEAMQYVFGKGAASSMIQFSSRDKVTIIMFNHELEISSTYAGDNNEDILHLVENYYPAGSTALYPATEEAIRILSEESDEYNVSVIVMTDGAGNVGSYNDTERAYKRSNREIPIYSITFAAADEEQLNLLAKLSNGKVFDGRTDLVKAFKNVRGYN